MAILKSDCQLTVRYYETDQMGIVHHSNYVRYFECGREQLLREIGCPIFDLERSGVMMAVIECYVKYRKSALLGDTLTLKTIVPTEPMARIRFNTKIYNQKGEALCEGFVVLAFVNSITRKPVPCPKSFLDAYRAHCIEETKAE